MEEVKVTMHIRTANGARKWGHSQERGLQWEYLGARSGQVPGKR